jgi:hypothetical protein
VEADIRALESPSGYKLFCSKPVGPRVAYIIQSVAAWFGNDLDDYDEGVEIVTIHHRDIVNSVVLRVVLVFICYLYQQLQLLPFSDQVPSESPFLLQ